jgi:hypothetical protein
MQALVGTVLSRAEWDAKCLRSFMKGMGTNERGIIQHLAHRSFQEVEAIKVKCGLCNTSLSLGFCCTCLKPCLTALNSGTLPDMALCRRLT